MPPPSGFLTSSVMEVEELARECSAEGIGVRGRPRGRRRGHLSVEEASRNTSSDLSSSLTRGKQEEKQMTATGKRFKCLVLHSHLQRSAIMTKLVL